MKFLFTRLCLVALVSFLGMCVGVRMVNAAPPLTMGYEGYVTDSSGDAQTGSQTVRIRLYNAVSGGTLLFDETHTSVTFSDGYFSIAIGSGTYNGGSIASFAALPFDAPYYLTIEVTSLSTGEMTPRTPLTAVPYAFTASGLVAQATNPSTGVNAGEAYFNTTSGTLRIFDGTSWLSILNDGLNVTSSGNLVVLGGIISSGAATALTLDSGTTGALNLGTGSAAKTITIGNTTGATTLTLQSGTGAITFQVGGTGTTGNVQVGAGGAGSTTPDLFVLDAKSTSGDPTGTNGGMYYNANTGKFRCFEGSAWANCISSGGGSGSDLQHATSYDTDEGLTNIPTGGAQVTLGTVSVTPTTALGDVYVTGWADAYSSNGTDQPLHLVIETTANCTGSVVGNASSTFLMTSAASAVNIKGALRVSGIAVDPGASSQSYSLCAAVTSGGGDSDIMSWGLEALVIDTGADVAEIYTTLDEGLEPGDVVSLDPRLQTGVKKSADAYDQQVLGIISTRPGVLIGGVDKEGVRAHPVALAGRVPVKVITENGPIEPGDALSPSSMPGVAMKASGTGPVIGRAMAAYAGQGVGMVVAFVKNTDGHGLNLSLQSVTPLAETDEGDNGLIAQVTAVRSESPRDAVATVTAMIVDGVHVVADSVVVRVTAMRGYFEDVFATVIHAERLCLKQSDGTEACMDAEQAQRVLGSDVTQTNPLPEPEVTPAL